MLENQMKALRALAGGILNAGGGGAGLSADLAEGSTTAKRKLPEHKHTNPHSLPIGQEVGRSWCFPRLRLVLQG